MKFPVFFVAVFFAGAAWSHPEPAFQSMSVPAWLAAVAVGSAVLMAVWQFYRMQSHHGTVRAVPGQDL